jgi:hypothetical protein
MEARSQLRHRPFGRETLRPENTTLLYQNRCVKGSGKNDLYSLSGLLTPRRKGVTIQRSERGQCHSFFSTENRNEHRCISVHRFPAGC